MAADAHKDAHVPVSLALARLSFISSLDTLTDVSYIYILVICGTSNLILPHVFVLVVLTGTVWLCCQALDLSSVSLTCQHQQLCQFICCHPLAICTYILTCMYMLVLSSVTTSKIISKSPFDNSIIAYVLYYPSFFFLTDQRTLE